VVGDVGPNDGVNVGIFDGTIVGVVGVEVVGATVGVPVIAVRLITSTKRPIGLDEEPSFTTYILKVFE
jgi:hypothetical protein